MGITDIFWLFFMFSALQPMLRQRMLEAMRTRKMSQIERQRGSRVILLIHRQETMRLLGFPMARYIDINDSEEVLRAIHMTGSTSCCTRRAGSCLPRCRSPVRSGRTRRR